MNLRARLKALEQRRRASNRRFRIVACTIGGPLNVATSTCTRRLSVNGCLSEIVMLDGSDEHLTDEDLERFILSFPIETS
jgi:hypothetical protein